MATSDIATLKSDQLALTVGVANLIDDYQLAQTNYAAAARTGDPAAIEAALTELQSTKRQLDDAKDELAVIDSEVDGYTALSSATNPDKTEEASKEKMANSEVVGTTAQDDAANSAATATKSVDGSLTERQGVPGVPSGAMPLQKQSAKVVIKDNKGNVKNADLRVKIRVPQDYLTSLTEGVSSELASLGGIVFPYTPIISFEHKADYASQAPMHSNFNLYFYQRSSISPITITGQFTVQNDADAGVYIATMHLLRALTKMRSGGATGDKDSGAPPPICKLDAYGDMMLNNVPVVVTSFKNDLVNTVDYYTIGKSPVSNNPYPLTSVPVSSSISVTLNPMYSRAEMQKFSVSSWLNDINVRKSGYL